MTIRLAHLSDIHFGGENRDAVAAAADFIRTGAFDLVVISGDLTRYGEAAEFQAAAKWLAALPGPRLVTPGNHDCPYFAPHERLFAPFHRFGRTIGPAPAQTHLVAGIAVCGLNSARGMQVRLNWSKGHVSGAQIAATLACLDRAPLDSVRVVVCHHPLVEMIGGPMTGRVRGGERAARAFAKARVDLVLSGHIHAPFAWPYPYEDGRTYAVGAGTLSVRERGCPPGFNVVEIERAAIRIAALAWTGSHYEPYRTWSLDRRVRALGDASAAHEMHDQ